MQQNPSALAGKPYGVYFPKGTRELSNVRSVFLKVYHCKLVVTRHCHPHPPQIHGGCRKW
eukprot:TRINITY_DN3728_c0_g1_i1.p4 TRINITY_DN3728_c0_g1~~TRINITY_DN3728_c0_g1_i1.p4  ORF type:complete len:60 (+),score=2.33 TRINITY_DN3728_c0_g1_i1:85-264(+)